MVELVRDLRSTNGYIDGIKTFAIDCGGKEFESLMALEGLMTMFLIFLH